MYTITMTGAPYTQSPGAWYWGEMLRSGVPTPAGARRIARKALQTLDQAAVVYDERTRERVAVERLAP
jgi:hypothetical protein